MKQAYVSSVERGQVRVSWERFWLWCAQLQVKPSYVFSIIEALAQKEGERSGEEILQDTLTQVNQRLKDPKAELSPSVRRKLEGIRDEVIHRFATGRHNGHSSKSNKRSDRRKKASGAK